MFCRMDVNVDFWSRQVFQLFMTLYAISLVSTFIVADVSVDSPGHVSRIQVPIQTNRFTKIGMKIRYEEIGMK